MKRKTKIIAMMALVIGIFTLPLTSANAADDKEERPRSLEGEWCGAYSNVELKGGIDLRELNTKIKNGEQAVAVSPYDRFGNNLSFTWYGGEKKLSIGLVDNLYRDIVSKSEETKIDMSTFLDIGDSSVTDVVYEGRTPLITEEQFKAGGWDARRAAYTCVPGPVGGDVSTGNLYLGISNSIQSFVGWLLDSEEWVGWAADTVAKVVKPLGKIMWMILTFAMVGFIIWLVSTIYRYAKGNISGRIAFQGIMATIIALGVFGAFTVNPGLMATFLKSTTGAVQNITKAAINETTSPKFCVSGIGDNAYKCNLFYNTVYKEWAVAEGFDKLKVSEKSAEVVGVPNVPLGGGKSYTGDWGVLTYSAMSRYHMQDVDADTLEDGKWTNTLPMNSNITIDMVRSYDARMGIEKTAEGEENSFAVPSHLIETESRTAKGLWMMFKALTLAPIAYVAAIKAWSLLMILIIFVRFIVESIRTVFRPDENRLSQPFRSLWDHFKMYLFSTLQIFILITLYNFMSNGPMIFLWIIISFTIIFIKPKRVQDAYDKAMVKFRQMNSKNLVRGNA